MVMKKVTAYEARFSLPAITNGTRYQVPFNEASIGQHFPLNEWELLNGSTQELIVEKNQNSSSGINVPSGRGKAEDFENGIAFTSMSIYNNGSGASVIDTAVLIVRKIVYVEVN